MKKTRLRPITCCCIQFSIFVLFSLHFLIFVQLLSCKHSLPSRTVKNHYLLTIYYNHLQIILLGCKFVTKPSYQTISFSVKLMLKSGNSFLVRHTFLPFGSSGPRNWCKKIEEGLDSIYVHSPIEIKERVAWNSLNQTGFTVYPYSSN